MLVRYSTTGKSLNSESTWCATGKRYLKRRTIFTTSLWTKSSFRFCVFGIAQIERPYHLFQGN